MICKICEKDCSENITFLCQKCYSNVKDLLEKERINMKKSNQHDVIIKLREYEYIYKTILMEKRQR